MPKYGSKASEKVEAMRERKKGTLKSGSGKKVRSRMQAIAIGLWITPALEVFAVEGHHIYWPEWIILDFQVVAVFGSIYSQLRSRLGQLYWGLRSRLSRIRNGVKLLKLIHRCGHARAFWILTYVEEILGGRESYRRKLSLDRYNNPLPWFTYPAIEYLQQFDFSKCNIFEYGSGNGSKFWAHRASTLTSVESDLKWYNFGIAEKAPNQTLLLRTEKEKYTDAIRYAEATFDVIVIDGEYRFNCAIEATKKIRSGGFIILDDSDCFPKVAKMLGDSGFSQVDFIGARPIYSYAGATSIFINKLFALDIPRNLDNKLCVLGGLDHVAKDDVLV